MSEEARLRDLATRRVVHHHGALALDLPLTLVNHAGGGHAFDLFEDTDAARRVIDRMLGFLGRELSCT